MLVRLGHDAGALANFGPSSLGIEGTIEFFEILRRENILDDEFTDLEYRLTMMGLLPVTKRMIEYGQEE